MGFTGHKDKNCIYLLRDFDGLSQSCAENKTRYLKCFYSCMKCYWNVHQDENINFLLVSPVSCLVRYCTQPEVNLMLLYDSNAGRKIEKEYYFSIFT